jgi:ATP-dependent Clp protease ATP-binding subunit ClpC
MFERFSDGARRVVVQAQEEARLLQHNYIGTEHILLGIVREGEGTAARALQSLGADLDALGQEIKALIGHGQHEPSGHIPFTPEAKRTLELSLRESTQLKSRYIGTEHILLGLVRLGEGPTAQVFTAHGISLDRARQEVIRLLGETGGEGPAGGEFHYTRISLEDIAIQLRSIGRRLAAIEAMLGVEDSPARQRLRNIETELAQVTREKETAIEEQDFERAAQARDQERRLLGRRREAEQAWLAEADEATTPPADDDPPAAADQ